MCENPHSKAQVGERRLGRVDIDEREACSHAGCLEPRLYGRTHCKDHGPPPCARCGSPNIFCDCCHGSF